MPGNVIFSGCDDAISVQNCVYCSQGEKKKKPNLDGKKKKTSFSRVESVCRSQQVLCYWVLKAEI